ncbi:MAG: hypothetical protein M9938_05920 [Solirubrobacterales bacterium]|nr:hypothetical protein [Solirubrobacterales bacterium]
MKREAERPLRESGEGVAEGFEESEEALREQAEDTPSGRNPKYDVGRPEAEPPVGIYGEADGIESSETPDEDWN